MRAALHANGAIVFTFSTMGKSSPDKFEEDKTSRRGQLKKKNQTNPVDGRLAGWTWHVDAF